ncbi:MULTISPECIES: fibronectin type III domain-containing protein [Rhodococcus]|uniref:fibronectin type III domain-containing protein n=1 Tax=Rhodococcus TaxID=1827 RepID=UPI001E3AA21A|nr:fibronectin type III domain-containing protein [Rhodococcus pyridinivorans]MCD2116811.1 fibronectin type III domain-containing protein [Rhodococcus pyridinivorans]MCZ4625981.1 fibronectin type III domain-containing protein [Rhodococcus pyridinivorans]MCZ4646936.1 fibronectin type III domain-containing protein [Rhodococcus pyridinivorans]MDJ0480288.1 fibronectin type III domain-containing protein [Rhodococcus pyridinivorans]MDV7253039.1 fibronectin type III domain-containing protein [Rhodoco
MEKLPRRRPSGHAERTQQTGNIPGLIIDYAIQQVNNFIGDLLAALDGITFGLFNLDALAGRFRGTETRLDREVVRLDNRIDQISDELGVVQIATYGYSDRWWKPPGAYGDIILDAIGGASGGGRSNNGGSGGTYRGGLGGWSGGWDKKVLQHDQCPPYIDIVVGETAAGASSDGGHGSTGKTTTFYAPDGTILAQATGGSSINKQYGSGSNTYRVRGGAGGMSGTTGGDGGAGSFDPGGKGNPATGGGGEGENGLSVQAGKIGVGSGGGGGAQASISGSGGKGGDGGWPSGPGGGGGAYISFGFAGNGGTGSAGAGYISTRISETRVTPPSVPSGLAASAVTATSATINWAASTDDFGVDQYEVLVNNVVRGYTEATSFPLTDLTPSTAYAVKLRAVDDNGNWSAFSSVLNFTTTA